MANINAKYKRFTGSVWDVIHYETNTAQVLRVAPSDVTNYPNSDQFVTGSVLNSLKSPNSPNGYLKLNNNCNIESSDRLYLKSYIGHYILIDNKNAVNDVGIGFRANGSANIEFDAQGDYVFINRSNALRAYKISANVVGTDTNLDSDFSLMRKGANKLSIKETTIEAASGVTFQQSKAPTTGDDLTNKRYVDMVAGYGMNPLVPARAATTANVTLSGLQTVDGVALVANDRVLVKNQTVAKDNGVYVVASGAWTRAADANNFADLTGALISVLEGTTNKRCIFYQKDEVSTVGTSNQTWILFSNTADYYTAGAGLTLTGNEFKIGDGGVGTSQLASNAVTNDKIKDGEISGTKISNYAITAGKIQNATITVDKLASDYRLLDSDVGMLTMPQQAPNNETLPKILLYLARQLKNIMGDGTFWYEAPLITLKELKDVNTNLATKQKQIAYGSTAPATPVSGDLWIDIS